MSSENNSDTIPFHTQTEKIMTRLDGVVDTLTTNKKVFIDKIFAQIQRKYIEDENNISGCIPDDDNTSAIKSEIFKVLKSKEILKPLSGQEVIKVNFKSIDDRPHQNEDINQLEQKYITIHEQFTTINGLMHRYDAVQLKNDTDIDEYVATKNTTDFDFYAYMFNFIKQNCNDSINLGNVNFGNENNENAYTKNVSDAARFEEDDASIEREAMIPTWEQPEAAPHIVKEEAERLEATRKETLRIKEEKSRFEAEKIEATRKETLRIKEEKSRIEAEKIKATRKEAERLEKEKFKEEVRIETLRVEAEKIEATRKETLRIKEEKSRIETLRIKEEKSRIDAERASISKKQSEQNIEGVVKTKNLQKNERLKPDSSSWENQPNFEHATVFHNNGVLGNVIDTTNPLLGIKTTQEKPKLSKIPKKLLGRVAQSTTTAPKDAWSKQKTPEPEPEPLSEQINQSLEPNDGSYVNNHGRNKTKIQQQLNENREMLAILEQPVSNNEYDFSNTHSSNSIEDTETKVKQVMKKSNSESKIPPKIPTPQKIIKSSSVVGDISKKQKSSNIGGDELFTPTNLRTRITIVKDKHQNAKVDAEYLVQIYINDIIEYKKKIDVLIKKTRTTTEETLLVDVQEKLKHVQEQNKKIYEIFHHGNLRTNRKHEITESFNKIYINEYLGKTNRRLHVDSITKDTTMTDRKKQIEKKKMDQQNDEYYGCYGPTHGWNIINGKDKFRRIVKFFELTFDYNISKAIIEATSFSDSVHRHLGMDPLTYDDRDDYKHFYDHNNTSINAFLEEWKICSSTKGGRKTRKNQKKKVSPIKTRKVKKIKRM